LLDEMFVLKFQRDVKLKLQRIRGLYKKKILMIKKFKLFGIGI